MTTPQASIWIRINGVGHAFSRELGCECQRCQTINFNLALPPRKLDIFQGWDDPPWRAHTSASILIGDADGEVLSHVLIDCGAGVVDSLMCSGFTGLDRLAALLITHWHPDRVLSINQLSESLRRTAQRNKRPFRKVQAYTTLPTYDWVRRTKGGLDYEFRIRPQEIVPEDPFLVTAGPVTN